MNRETIIKLMQDMENLQAEVRRLAVQKPLFTVLNVNNTPISLGADQNDYDFGDYDLVTFNPTAARTITGFANGVLGRQLIVRNRSSGLFSITLAHNSASSLAANRIFTHTGANVTLGERRWAMFVYAFDTVAGANRWLLAFILP